jgi:hypothetical protein
MIQKLFAPEDKDYIDKLNQLYTAFLATGSEDIAPKVSADPNNRAVLGSDNGVYVSDDLNPDPLAYYILARS